jgi:hypothetical protein
MASSLPNRFKSELRPGGFLLGLEIPDEKSLARAKSEFPKLSQVYWDFVAEIGIGEAQHSGISVCLPHRLEYKGAEELNLVVVSDPQSSWAYCLTEDGGDTVSTFDYIGREIDHSEADFAAFINSHLDFSEAARRLDQVEELERELLTSSTRANSTRVAELLHDVFTEVGASGTYYNKSTIISSFLAEAQFQFKMEVIDRKLLDSSTAIIFYNLQTMSGGHETRETLRTSLWRFVDNWQLVWHQGTVSSTQLKRDRRKLI